MKEMKKTGLTLLTAIALTVIAATNIVKAQPGARVSFQLFYDELAPHGEWINDPDYGYIWLPNAEPGFQPYATNGYWVMTNYGNTWVSNYAWGWAPFHYGRWTYTDYYGWAWVPGYEWGPAWVSWRSGGGYYGWAPLGPRMSINVHINIPSRHWVFVPQRYITSPRIYSYYTPYRNRVTIYNRTTVINNTYVYNNRTYVSGPRRSEVERATGGRVAIREINRTSRPGRAAVNNRSVSLYRPEVDRNSRTSARPSRVTDAATARNSRATNGRTTTGTANNRRATTAPREATTRTTDNRAIRPSTGRTAEATRPSSTSRTRGEAVRPNNTSRTGTTPSTRARSTAPQKNTVRSTGNTARRTDSRATSRAQRTTRPSVSQNNRSTSRTQRATPAQTRSSRDATQRASSPSRSSTVRSQSASRPTVSTSSRSQNNRSSATRSSRSSAAGRQNGIRTPEAGANFSI